MFFAASFTDFGFWNALFANHLYVSLCVDNNHKAKK